MIRINASISLFGEICAYDSNLKKKGKNFYQLK